MLKIEPKAEIPGTVCLALCGRMNGNSLGDLRRAIQHARRIRGQVALDLSEVTLVDRPSLEFLAEQAGRGDIQVVNCPQYIEPWIARAR